MTFKVDGLDEFIGALQKLGDESEFKKQSALWLDALGFQFLEEVQNEIIRTGTVDTRRLLNGFTKGGEGNLWVIEDGGLSLSVGTNVEYADSVNDGHLTDDPAKGRDKRWVPGYWQGDRFFYDPDAETGMLLIFHWVEGSHYFDNAEKIFTAMFEKSLEKKVREWAEGAWG